MSNEVEFRSITKNDADELYELLNTVSEEVKKFFHPHKFDKKTLTQICSSTKDHYFVLTINKKIIGYSMLRFFGYNIPSFGICIRNGYEHKGYGRLMTEKTIQKALQLGYKEVILTIHKENVRAMHLYIKTGFDITLRNPKTGEIKMKKSL
jgi:L-amino acid N-acyltransferase YncA